MVMARLHVICGNCGCNDEWELRVEREGNDVSNEYEEYEDSASMACGNCATIHALEDNAKTVKANRTKRKHGF